MCKPARMSSTPPLATPSLPSLSCSLVAGEISVETRERSRSIERGNIHSLSSLLADERGSSTLGVLRRALADSVLGLGLTSTFRFLSSHLQ